MTEALKKMNTNGVFVSEQEVIRISKKYQITKIEAFGSVLRSDFTSDSDIDLLITFDENDSFRTRDKAKIIAQEYARKT